MSESAECLVALEKAAEAVLVEAKATVGGVGMACFENRLSQETAFQRAWAKEAAAKEIVEAVARFKTEHGNFS